MEKKEMGKAQDETKKIRKKSNLYSCKIDIALPRKEIISTKRLLQKILRHIDPQWRFIRIHDKEISPLRIPDNPDLNDCLAISSNGNNGAGTGTSSTQSLSVVLFLHEDRGCVGILDNDRGDTEKSAAWRFHHEVKQFSKTDSTVIALQKYYELDPGLPLWAVAQVHYGNEVLRFNIFVKDFQKMKTFYETLIGKSCEVLRPAFCYFVLNTHLGREIHLSLKWLPKMSPKYTTSAVLRFKFRKLDAVKTHLLSPPVLITSRQWQTVDPDGNVLLLEEIVQYHVDGKHSRSKSRIAKDNLVFV